MRPPSPPIKPRTKTFSPISAAAPAYKSCAAACSTRWCKLPPLRRHNATPAPRSVVTVHYEGRLIDGQVFDSSRRGTGTPPAFRVNELITGWQVALVNMHIGDVWELYVPAAAGYGERGAGRDIPGHSTLIFRIELLDIA